MFKFLATLYFTLTGTLPMKTPAELAVYTKCDYHRISHWIGQRIEYQSQTCQKWLSAEMCMHQGSGDCKCMAIIAKETLNMCDDFTAKIVILKGKTKNHAVTLFTDDKGNRGYINGIYRNKFKPGTPWKDIIESISGGPWVIDSYV